MLYIFAGFPLNGLHAGGLQRCIEDVEYLGELEHNSSLVWRKGGVYAFEPYKPDYGEWLRDDEVVLSPSLLEVGITWDWFDDNWAFGNGITIHKTFANPEYETVVHGTDLSLDDFLKQNGVTKLSDIELENRHIRHEGWEKYEKRWLPGTCPQENHIVNLTWMITTHKLPDFAYNRIRELIEGGGEIDKKQYKDENFAELYTWDGNPAFHRG